MRTQKMEEESEDWEYYSESESESDCEDNPRCNCKAKPAQSNGKKSLVWTKNKSVFTLDHFLFCQSTEKRLVS